MRKCKNFLIKKAGRIQDGLKALPVAVFGEAELSIGGDSPKHRRDVSFILTMPSPGVLELAHAVRRPNESPNRKIARKVCHDRLVSGLGYRMSLSAALGVLASEAGKEMDWLAERFVGEGFRNADPFELGEVLVQSQNFFSNPAENFCEVKPWDFAALARAFFVKGFPVPRKCEEMDDDDYLAAIAPDIVSCTESLLDLDGGVVIEQEDWDF